MIKYNAISKRITVKILNNFASAKYKREHILALLIFGSTSSSFKCIIKGLSLTQLDISLIKQNKYLTIYIFMYPLGKIWFLVL